MWSRPFCNLLHFERALPAKRPADQKILIVAPMSGHYATLLRAGTVEALMQGADVYITDWTDARLFRSRMARSTSTTTSITSSKCCTHIGQDTHVVAVCQPSVPVLAAVLLSWKRRKILLFRPR